MSPAVCHRVPVLRTILSTLWMLFVQPLPACVAASFGVLALAPQPAAAQGGPSVAYARALKAYREGKNRVAYRLLIAIVRKYPDHQPSQLLLGRMLFRFGHVGRAAKHFRRVSPDLVPNDAAYEYGVTMFVAKNCQRAIAGFARVPPGSRLADVAAFYRGICYLRRGDYDLANLYLGRARHLPSNLQVSRRQALAQVRQRLSDERRGAAIGPTPYFIAPSPPVYPFYAEPSPAASGASGESRSEAAKKSAQAAPPPAKAGFTNAITPSLTLTQKTDTIDYNGYSTSQSDTQDIETKVSFKSRYDAAPGAGGEQAYAQLGLDLSQFKEHVTGSSTRYVAYQTDPNTIVNQTSDTAPTSLNNGVIKINPEVGYPITSALDVALGYAYTQTDANMQASQRTDEIGPYGFAELGLDLATFKVSVTEKDDTGPDGKSTGGSLEEKGELTKNWDTASAGLSFTQAEWKAGTPPPPPGQLVDIFIGTRQDVAATFTKHFDPLSFTVAVTNTTYAVANPSQYVKQGEDSSLTTDLSATRSFEFGGSFSIKASLSQLGNYKSVLDDKTQAADADGKYPQKLFRGNGTMQSILATLKLTPLDWLFGTVSYQYTIQDFTLASITPYPPTASSSAAAPASDDSSQNQSLLQAVFDQATPRTLTEFTIQVGVTKTF